MAYLNIESVNAKQCKKDTFDKFMDKLRSENPSAWIYIKNNLIEKLKKVENEVRAYERFFESLKSILNIHPANIKLGQKIDDDG